MIGKKITCYLQRKTSPTKTADAMGGWTESWEDIKTFRSKMSVSKGNENIMYNKETVISTHTLTCDYFSGMTEKDRIRIGTDYYDIKFIDNIEQLSIGLKVYVELRV